MSPFLHNKHVKPEIKVSSIKSSLLYLDKGKIFVDRHLPAPEPVVLSRLVPHSRFTPEYFTALHYLVAAPGPDNPANT